MLEKLVVERIREAFNLSSEDVRCTIGQEGGADIKLSAKARTKFPFAIECKRRASFDTLYGFYDQASKNSDGKLIPLVIIRADRKEPLVILNLDYFLTMVAK